MVCLTQLVAVAASWSLAAAHTVITYPGWRGDNIITNGTKSLTDANIPDGSLGINMVNGTIGFPYGMQWMYPCGGMSTSHNRTKWPVRGGAIAIQPGWFPGHSMAQFYFNMGYGNEPLNYSHSMVNGFSITGPTNLEYNGTFCLPQLPLPVGYEPKVGDNATIQVIELAQHGAALYNCADITFADVHDPEIVPVTKDNCFNSTQPDEKIGFQMVYQTTSSPAPRSVEMSLWASIAAPLVLGAALGASWM